MKSYLPIVYPFKILIATVMILLLTNSCSNVNKSTGVNSVSGKNEMPRGGQLINQQPVGKGWVNLLASLDEWNITKAYWKFDNGILHGDYNGGKFHNYAYTKATYSNFELNAVVRMSGREANSGVCIRIKPTDFDNVPGYQVDMGHGYWGSLWEERKAGMVQQYPKEMADKLVKENDWNHYYIVAENHHIKAWLNGVKTIDTIHIAGYSEGAIGCSFVMVTSIPF